MNNKSFFSQTVLPQIKIFYISFISIFLISSLLNLGVHAPQISKFSPQNVSQNNWAQALTNNNTFYLLADSQNLNQSENMSYSKANAYIAIDLDSGKILEGKNISSSLPIASLNKVMTAVVTLDLASASDVFVTTTHAANIIPTRIGVIAGQKMLRDELLYALLLTSANDAAEVLAEGIDAKYGKGTFIKAMNIKAKSLGMKNTNFSNPQGFDSRLNYSSVSDLAVLAHYALSNYPLFKQIVKTDYHFLPQDNNHKQFDLYNWNGLLGVYPNILGLKIGNTEGAGHTTMVASERENKKVLAIILGAPGQLERDMWAAALLNEGFWRLARLTPITINNESLKLKYSQWKYWN